MTSPAQHLIDQLAAEGVKLDMAGGRLVFEGPAGVVTDEVRREIGSLRQELVTLLSPAEQRRALQPAEQQVYLLDNRSEFRAYILSGAFRLVGEFDVAVFQQAVEDVVARHASLRACLVDEHGSAELFAAGSTPLRVRVTAATESTLAARLAEVADERIDLRIPPLYRVDVLVLGAREHVVLVRAHHLVGDDYSIRAFCEHVLRRYEEILGLAPPRVQPRSNLPPPSSRWGDDPARRALVLARRDALRDAVRMWLPGAARGEVALAPRTADVVVSRDALRIWRRVRQELGVTSFALVAAILTVAVRAAGGPDDQLLGSSETGRGPGDQSSIGYYARPILVRARCSGNRTFGDHVRAVAADLVDASGVGEVPIDELVGTAAQSKHGGCVLFAVGYAPVDLPKVAGLTISAVPLRTNDTRHDLRLEAQLGDEVKLSLTSRPEVVSSRFVACVARTLAELGTHLPATDEPMDELFVRLAALPAVVQATETPDVLGLTNIAARRRGRT